MLTLDLKCVIVMSSVTNTVGEGGGKRAIHLVVDTKMTQHLILMDIFCFLSRWDNGETEKLSPWDVERISDIGNMIQPYCIIIPLSAGKSAE